MVGDEDVAAVRTLLDGDFQSFGRMLDEWNDRPGEDRRFGALLVFTVIAAARARFGNGWSHADVTRYAEHVRARSAIRGVPVSACEAQLLYALESRREPPIPSADATCAQFALIMALGGELETSARGRLLVEARAQADHWLEWCARYGPPVNGAWQTGRRRCQGAAGSPGFGDPGRCRVGRRRRRPR